jgi:hypothetical protein
MAQLPEMAIDGERRDAGDWRYQARLFFPNDVTITLDLRLHSESELAPEDAAVIEAQLRRQREGIIDNYLPVLDQVREWQGEQIFLGFFR